MKKSEELSTSKGEGMPINEVWESLPIGAWFFHDSPGCVERFSVQERTSGGCSIVCSTPYHHDRAKRNMQEIAERHNQSSASSLPQSAGTDALNAARRILEKFGTAHSHWIKDCANIIEQELRASSLPTQGEEQAEFEDWARKQTADVSLDLTRCANPSCKDQFPHYASERTNWAWSAWETRAKCAEAAEERIKELESPKVHQLLDGGECRDPYHRPTSIYCLQCLPSDAPLGALLLSNREPTASDIERGLEIAKLLEERKQAGKELESRQQPSQLADWFAEWIEGIEGGQHLDMEDREALADFLQRKIGKELESHPIKEK